MPVRGFSAWSLEEKQGFSDDKFWELFVTELHTATNDLDQVVNGVALYFFYFVTEFVDD